MLGLKLNYVNKRGHCAHDDATGDGLVSPHVTSTRNANSLWTGFNMGLHERHKTPFDVILNELFEFDPVFPYRFYRLHYAFLTGRMNLTRYRGTSSVTSLAPGRWGCNFKSVTFQLIIQLWQYQKRSVSDRQCFRRTNVLNLECNALKTSHVK